MYKRTYKTFGILWYFRKFRYFEGTIYNNNFSWVKYGTKRIKHFISNVSCANHYLLCLSLAKIIRVNLKCGTNTRTTQVFLPFLIWAKFWGKLHIIMCPYFGYFVRGSKQ